MRRAAVLLLVPLLLGGCDTSNYAFKIDRSIKIVQPTPQAGVSLPVSVRWTDSEQPTVLKVAPADPAAQYYAVFVDVSPMGPGKHLASLVEHSDRCRLNVGCPTAIQLADAHVHLAAAPTLQLEFIADLRPTSRGDTKDLHEVTIVRMRGDKRIGEAAFRQTFYVHR